jgi:hypothetical protein
MISRRLWLRQEKTLISRKQSQLQRNFQSNEEKRHRNFWGSEQGKIKVLSLPKVKMKEDISNDH